VRGEPLLAIARQAHWNCCQILREIGVFDSRAGFPVIFLCAAHKAVRAASESLAMNQTRVHVVITDVRKSDQPHASSVVNVPSGAGLARLRAAALSQRCSFVNDTTRRPVCGQSGCRTLTGTVKANAWRTTRHRRPGATGVEAAARNQALAE
jgi:hypothetical protein